MLKGKELMERGMGNVVREAVEEKQDVSLIRIIVVKQHFVNA
jgi:hypothetical protein